MHEKHDQQQQKHEECGAWHGSASGFSSGKSNGVAAQMHEKHEEQQQKHEECGVWHGSASGFSSGKSNGVAAQMHEKHEQQQQKHEDEKAWSLATLPQSLFSEWKIEISLEQKRRARGVSRIETWAREEEHMSQLSCHVPWRILLGIMGHVWRHKTCSTARFCTPAARDPSSTGRLRQHQKEQAISQTSFTLSPGRPSCFLPGSGQSHASNSLELAGFLVNLSESACTARVLATT